MHVVNGKVGARLKPRVRREQLLDTAAAMFADKACGDVFLEDIAARGHIESVILAYYESKPDVYVAMFICQRRFLARPAEDPRTAARRVTFFRHEQVSMRDGLDRYPEERPLR